MPRLTRRVFIVLAALSAAAAPVQASIIISEIMYNPAGTDKDLSASPPYDREWIEIYNTSTAPIDISGWQLGYGSSQPNQWTTPFPANTTLGAGRPLVITGSAATFDANWGAGWPRLEVGSFPTLGNTSGAVAIRNQSGIVQDTVNYASSGSWPTTRGSQGNSISLLPHALNSTANNVGSNWMPSSQGVYGARWVNGGGHGENNGSPGNVVTVSQAPFEPSPDAAWSMVVFPDTQNYSKDTRDLPIFSQMTTWVRDNRDLFNIKLVMQEGDIVNQNSQVNPTSGNQSGTQQWANARAAMSILDGHVPYIITLGNHDMGTTSAQTRDTQFNTFFNPAQNPLNDPAQGGILKGVFQPGRLDNAYFEVAGPDGRNLLIFALEFLPRNAVVAWANQIAALPAYRDHTAVLLTHSYLSSSSALMSETTSSYPIAAGGDFNNGVNMWNKLLKVNSNFEMTFSGHVGGDGVAYVRSLGEDNNAVHQILLNAQFETNGGNGWFLVVEFLKDGKTARVRTYSPFLDLARTDAFNAYTFQLSALPSLIADFNGDRAVDGVDLAAWMANYGTGTTLAHGDADGDGDVDGNDLLMWQRNITGGAPSTSTPIPEPASIRLILAGVALTAFAVRWNSSEPTAKMSG